MDNVKEILTEEEFNAVITSATTPVLADFWATWCGPCRMQAPILAELAKELNEKIKVIKVNVDDNESLAVKYGIAAIPTLILFKDGKAVEKTVGLSDREELIKIIEKHS